MNLLKSFVFFGIRIESMIGEEYVIISILSSRLLHEVNKIEIISNSKIVEIIDFILIDTLIKNLIDRPTSDSELYLKDTILCT